MYILLSDEELFAQLVGKYNSYAAKPVANGTTQCLFCRIMLNSNQEKVQNSEVISMFGK